MLNLWVYEVYDGKKQRDVGKQVQPAKKIQSVAASFG